MLQNAGEFNGWTNRETWATALHINNDEGLIDAVSEMAKLNDNKRELGDQIQAFIVDDVLEFDNVSTNRSAFLMLSDIGSLYRVDWQEIAESILQDVAQ